MQITLNDVPVWKGRRLGVGKYAEQENAIPEAELAKVLERLRCGDEYLGGENARAPASPRAPITHPLRRLEKEMPHPSLIRTAGLNPWIARSA